MHRVAGGMSLLALSLALVGCSVGKPTSEPAANSQPAQPAAQQPQASNVQPNEPSAPQPADMGALPVGAASGSYTAKGQTVTLKYAYAGRGERFGEESTIILLTDTAIPPEAVVEEIKTQSMLLDEKIRGLEYVVAKDSYWVRYHPGQYQETRGGQLKEFSVSDDRVTGRDENEGDLSNGKYSRSVRFVAPFVR